jgi:hypothetical protein
MKKLVLDGEPKFFSRVKIGQLSDLIICYADSIQQIKGESLEVKTKIMFQNGG